MMGWGGMFGGALGGNSSSSASILSALAPPFTVDRVNPNSYPIPSSHYSNSPFGVPTYYGAWQYPLPSCPGPDLFVDSIGVTSVPLSDAYELSANVSTSPPSATAHWSATSPGNEVSGCQFAYVGEVEPSYPSYFPPVVGQVNMLNEGSPDNLVPAPELSSNSRLDCTQNSTGWEYGSCWWDTLTPDCGKHAKLVDIDGNILSSEANFGGSLYHNQPSQGGVHSIENKHKYKEEANIPCQKFNPASTRGFHAGSLSVEPMKDTSCFEQNVSFFSYDANRTCTQASSSTYYPESHSSVSACEMPNNFTSYQSSCSIYKQYDKSVEVPFTGPSLLRRPSDTLVISSLPATDINSGQSIASHKPAYSHGDGFLHFMNFYDSYSLKQKNSRPSLSSAIEEDSCETSLFNFPKEMNGSISPSLMSVFSCPPHSKDASDHNVKATFTSQLSDVNAFNGFTMAGDNVQVVSSAEIPSDFVDPPNTTVDSPCWKGASSSNISLFDLEAGNCKYVKKNEYAGFGCEGPRNLNLPVDSDKGFSETICEANKNHQSACARNGGVHPLETDVNAICSNKEESSSDDATSCGPNTLSKDSALQNSLTSGFDLKVSDAKHIAFEEETFTTPNDASESGAVAVHAAEKVLGSPASQADAVECPKADPKFNVPSVIKAMHNLSELLLSYLSNDAYSLEEENYESLKHIISNLDFCMNQKIFPKTKQPGPNDPVQHTSEKHEDQSTIVGTISGSSPTVNDATNSHIKPDFQHMRQKGSCDSGKKDEKSPMSSPVVDDLFTITSDDMAKDIKKVLEDNFHLVEDINPQALLFKNLWLEAEAKLCSISYRACFDMVKIQMETIKLKEQEHEDLAEMMSNVCISPGTKATLEVAPEAHDGTLPKPSLKNFSNSSMSELDDDIKPRFTVLKSEEDNPSPTKEEEEEPEVLDGPVMEGYNLLQSVLLGREEEAMHGVVGGEPAGEKNVGPSCVGDHPENGALNVVLKPFLQCQTDILFQGHFGSYVDGAGCESPNESYLSVSNDPAVDLSNNSTMVNQHNAGGHDSPSSDWEHVLKDDF